MIFLMLLLAHHIFRAARYALLTELRCYDAFGYEFFSSSMCARVIYALPLALDAVAVVGARRGQVRMRVCAVCLRKCVAVFMCVTSRN